MGTFLQDSAVGDVTRGGQLVIHFLRMIWQVLRKFGGAMLITMTLVSVALFLTRTDSYQRYLTLRYCVSWASLQVFRKPLAPTTIERRDGTQLSTTVGALNRSPTMRSTAVATLHAAAQGAVYSLCGVTVLFVLLFRWVWRAGTRQREEQHVRGAEIVAAEELTKQLVRTKRGSTLTIADVPLLEGSETSHILLTGSPGTGKSTCLHRYLQAVRKKGYRVICFSPSGDMIQWFYRAGRDRILNPFDQRCPAWNLWDECPEDYHFDMVAAAIVPEPVRADPFWNTAARQVLASLFRATQSRGEMSIPRVLELLTQVDLKTLQQYLVGTEAFSLIDPGSEKASASIRITATTYARSLRFLPQRSEETFHIREWVHCDDDDGWMFLNALPDQLDSARPLLSAWLEILVNSLMSLPPRRDRRVCLIIDEVPTLNKIPSLSNFLAQSRKYGGCGVIAFQQISQLRERYGKDAADSIAGSCATWACMRQNDPETAKWVSDSFGQTEILEANQGVSYGVNDMRDGVSLSQQRKIRSLLLSSEILNLDDLEGYIRLPGRVPVGHFKMKYQPIRTQAQAFIARTDLPGPIAPPVVVPPPAVAPPEVTLSGDLFGEAPSPEPTAESTVNA